MSKIKKAGLALLLLVALGLFGVHHSDEQKATFSAARITVRSPASLDDQTEISFNPLENYRYTYAFKRRIAFHGLNQSLPEIAYEGEFFVTILNKEPSGFTALVGERIQHHEASAATPLKIRVGAHGDQVELFGAPSNEGDALESEAILKDLIANWAFFLSVDTVGEFIANYEWISSEKEIVRIQKTKQTYRDSAGRLPRILSSTHHMNWDLTRGVPIDVMGTEVTQFGLGKAAPALSSESDYAIRLQSVEVANKELARIAENLGTPKTLTIAGTSRGDHPDLVSLSWPSLRAELGNVDRLDNSGRLKLFGRLVRLLRVSRVGASELLSMIDAREILNLGARSTLFRTVVGALASVATAEAQAILVKVYLDSNCALSGKGMILTSLTTTPAGLENSTRDFLLHLAQTESDPNLAHGAAYALGASLQDKPASPGTIEAVRQMWASVAKGGDLEEKLAALDVIGNTGRVDYLPDLREVITKSGNDALRAKAVFALRFIQSAEATKLLMSSFSDPVPRVRQMAVAAIAFSREPHAVFQAPMKLCSASEAIISIRDACTAVLSAQAEDDSN